MELPLRYRSELLYLTLLICAHVQHCSHDVLPTFVHTILASCNVTIKRVDFIYNLFFEQPQIKPEDQWSCKRSPDILASYKHKIYKTWKKTRSRNDLDLQYSFSLTELVVCIYLFSGHKLQLFLKYPLVSPFSHRKA